jgi:hypothetical protein
MPDSSFAFKLRQLSGRGVTTIGNQLSEVTIHMPFAIDHTTPHVPLDHTGEQSVPRTVNVGQSIPIYINCTVLFSILIQTVGVHAQGRACR